MNTLRYLLPIFLFAVISSSYAATEKEGSALIGIVNNNEPGYRSEVVTPTVRYLREALPEISFRTVDISAYKAIDDIERMEPDFVIVPSQVYYTLSLKMNILPMAVRRNAFASDANQSAGSALVVLNTRSDLTDLDSLRGKSVSAALPDSLGGWLAMAAELSRSGRDPDRFFKTIRFQTYQIPEVISDVLEGRSDAGVLSACQLEMAENSGLIEPGRLKVLNAKETPGFACAHSTDLYPDQIFATLNSHYPPSLLKKISVALLSMPPDYGDANSESESRFSWDVSGRFDSLNRLAYDLKIGPYTYLKDWSLEGIFRRFTFEILAVIGALLFLALNECRLMRLVKRRTAKLNCALVEKEQMLSDVRRLNRRLHIMERNSIAAQMSSMIAHELKQPLGAIINYSAVMTMNLESRDTDESALLAVNDAVNREAHRICDIVDRVRSYVKANTRQRKPHRLDDLVKRSLDSFRHYADNTPNIKVSFRDAAAVIEADDLEIEILFLNLLKNAGRAVKSVKHGSISVTTTSGPGIVTVEIADNGPALTDTQFRNLSELSESTTSDGLGLGLQIVRSIVDAHSAALHIARRQPQGLQISVTFDRLENNQ